MLESLLFEDYRLAGKEVLVVHRSLCVMLLLTGCASRSELAELRALLEECRNDKLAAQEAVRACEDRFEREVRQWSDLEEVVTTVIPQTIEGFRRERDAIIDLVPEQAREEVGAYLDELTDALGRGFQVLREENESVLLELEIAQTKLDALEARADSIDSQTTAITEVLEGELRRALEDQRRALEAQRRVRREVSGLIESVHEFDQRYVSDQESRDRLRLNRRERETIKAFHDDLVGKLSALASGTTEPRSVP